MTPSGYGAALWQALEARVTAEGGGVYGIEALGALRIEKGHVTHAELDGRVTLDDAGLGRMASSKKPFIGSVLRHRAELSRTDRPQLVHLEPVTAGERFSIGAVLCDPAQPEGHGVGWVTGVTVAPAFDGRWVGDRPLRRRSHGLGGDASAGGGPGARGARCERTCATPTGSIRKGSGCMVEIASALEGQLSARRLAAAIPPCASRKRRSALCGSSRLGPTRWTPSARLRRASSAHQACPAPGAASRATRAL